MLPDSLIFVDNMPYLEAGGNHYTIDIQVMYHGINVSETYTRVYFKSDDPSLVDIPAATSVVTDANGRATLNITTGQSYGNVTITATLLSPDGNVRASKTYAVNAAGRVTGTVVEDSGRRIPGATVTLYTSENGVKGAVVPLPGNPTTASEDGAYVFEKVPYGSYVIGAAIDDKDASYNLTVADPTQSQALLIPGYAAATPTPTPTPAPTEEPTPTVTPVPASPTPAPKTPTGDTTKQLLWIGGIAVVLAVIIIGIQMLRQKKQKK